jgi:uncharacterized lipoprotein NlpE involved in copper resistance
MKKLFIAVAVISLIYSCAGNTQKPQEQASAEPVQVAGEHNAGNSLDYKGTYKGEIPAADAPGILISITLSDSTYIKTMKYIDRGDETFEEKGNYTWNAESGTIILQGAKDSPGRYLVGENTLTQLDMEGNKITGDMAGLYILKKQ